MTKYNDRNEEIPDNTPVEMPLGYEHPESLEQMMARMIRSMREDPQAQGIETFEEADDFDINDPEGDFQSPYELKPMQEEYVRDEPRASDQQGSQSRDESGDVKGDAEPRGRRPAKEAAKKLAKKKAQEVPEGDAEESVEA